MFYKNFVLALLFIATAYFIWSLYEPEAEQVVTKKTEAITSGSNIDTAPVTIETPIAPVTESIISNSGHHSDEPIDIRSLTRQQLIELILSKANYLEPQLQEFNNLHLFAEKFLRIADSAGDDPTIHDSPIYKNIKFSENNMAAMGGTWGKTEFQETATRIYANLPKVESLGNKAFITWSREDSEEFILFKIFAMNPEFKRNNVWINSPYGWDPGIYKVAVYSGDEYLNLLTQGSYTIIAIPQQ